MVALCSLGFKRITCLKPLSQIVNVPMTIRFWGQLRPVNLFLCVGDACTPTEEVGVNAEAVEAHASETSLAREGENMQSSVGKLGPPKHTLAVLCLTEAAKKL